MSVWQVLGLAFLVAIGLYLVVRLASAAFFKSKQQYESEKRNEPE